MKKFKFRLQRVLDTRCHEEEKAQQVFTNARRQLSREEATLQQLLQKQATMFNITREKRVRGTAASSELADIQYREALSKHVALQHGRIVEARHNADQARKALEIILQKRKALERLKETEYATFQHDVLHVEQQTMDELAARADGRQSIWTEEKNSQYEAKR